MSRKKSDTCWRIGSTGFVRVLSVCAIMMLKAQFSILNSQFPFLAPLSSVLSPLSTVSAQAQQGKASFYAKSAAGSKTANGETLCNDSLTCAHRTFPFGTYLRVTNMSNDKSVIVRVNDRGPYVRGRIIDLSRSAAEMLGMIQQGIAKVQVEMADGITIPLKAPTEIIKFPKLEIDSIELTGSMKPIWQEDLLIDHEEMRKKMRRTSQMIIRQKINSFH